MSAAGRGARRTTSGREPREGPHESSNGPEQRKLRNRMSQRAFRARQAMKIQELEERLEHTTAPDLAWATQLQDQNTKLRQQLLEVHKKAINIQISLKALSDATSKALGIDSMTIDSLVPASDAEPSSTSDHVDTPPSDCTIELDREDSQQPGLCDTEQYPHDPTAATYTEAGASDALLSDITLRDFNIDFFSTTAYHEDDSAVGLVQQGMSIIPLHTSQLGFEHYRDLRERATAACGMVPNLKTTNSSLSDHIDAFEACFASDYSRTGQLTVANKQPVHRNLATRFPLLTPSRLLDAIEFMITSFVATSWQPMRAWETYTRTLSALKDLTAWRMDRTEAKYRRIVPQYRPRRLQIAAPHPSVIDWVPWSSLRDKLIIHHSANPKLDQILSDLGQAYVVQADLSTLVKCPQPVIGYVPVWALVQAITTSSSITTPSSSSTLPAPSTTTLFDTPHLATQAHLLLGLGNGRAFNYRLDPVFFELHPELYDHTTADVMAQGVRLRPNSRFADAKSPVPGAVVDETIVRYREFSRIALACVAV